MFFTETLLYSVYRIDFGEELETYSYRTVFLLQLLKLEISNSARLGIKAGREKWFYTQTSECIVEN